MSVLLLDNSLSIVNRTGAYYLARDICREFVPAHADVRYWRLGRHAPEGLFRKLMARLMMLEIGLLGNSERCLIDSNADVGGFRVFLDPLYVLRSRLTDRDIVLCHDVGPLTHSELYDPRTVENYRLAYGKIARAKPGMVFVSDWSRARFGSIFGANFRHQITIPLYMRTELFNGSDEAVAALKGRRFFLTVGALETRKNQVAALKAFRDGHFWEQGVAYVLCGARGAGHEEISTLAANEPGVFMLNYVPDAQLRWLYEHAEAFILPSLLEGFGMPALEAAYMGLLPIVSADSALVEAVGGVCMEVSPHDHRSIADAMHRALTRGEAEKMQMSLALRQMAAGATKEKFLGQWRNLLLSEQVA
ncbi:glycosyltransferase [Pseudaminobacter soli (ex Li et al. 2025)]|uniref:Mannosyltransferase n=1 Tax=Pseudaminobacter soli (ex Li et al. 2025) TaxID=1295366 RepID=A0A2P7S7U1_9HYPH|nr:glycosyltransferase [Mesorhizobium soli]PSJ58549.1 mannosyltransferase [Mesorhizobium soli]